MNHQSASSLRTAPRCRQQGVALIVALILLVIATLTGMAGIRNTALQESLTTNLYDRTIAMQAAELALAAAAEALTDGTVTLANGKVADCSEEAPPCRVVPSDTFSGTNDLWQSVTSDLNSTLKADTNPEFYVQWIGSQSRPLTGQAANCLQYGAQSMCPEARYNLYRITARSSQPTTDNDRAIVALSRIVTIPVGI
jgi:type IV pilus assembly protein PilX